MEKTDYLLRKIKSDGSAAIEIFRDDGAERHERIIVKEGSSIFRVADIVLNTMQTAEEFPLSGDQTANERLRTMLDGRLWQALSDQQQAEFDRQRRGDFAPYSLNSGEEWSDKIHSERAEQLSTLAGLIGDDVRFGVGHDNGQPFVDIYRPDGKGGVEIRRVAAEQSGHAEFAAVADAIRTGTLIPEQALDGIRSRLDHMAGFRPVTPDMTWLILNDQERYLNRLLSLKAGLAQDGVLRAGQAAALEQKALQSLDGLGRRFKSLDVIMADPKLRPLLLEAQKTVLSGDGDAAGLALARAYGHGHDLTLGEAHRTLGQNMIAIIDTMAYESGMIKPMRDRLPRFIDLPMLLENGREQNAPHLNALAAGVEGVFRRRGERDEYCMRIRPDDMAAAIKKELPALDKEIVAKKAGTVVTATALEACKERLQTVRSDVAAALFLKPADEANEKARQALKEAQSNHRDAGWLGKPLAWAAMKLAEREAQRASEARNTALERCNAAAEGRYDGMAQADVERYETATMANRDTRVKYLEHANAAHEAATAALGRLANDRDSLMYIGALATLLKQDLGGMLSLVTRSRDIGNPEFSRSLVSQMVYTLSTYGHQDLHDPQVVVQRAADADKAVEPKRPQTLDGIETIHLESWRQREREPALGARREGEPETIAPHA